MSVAAAVLAELTEADLDLLAEPLGTRIAAQQANEPDGFLDVAGASEFLSCPRSRVYALVSAKRIPHQRDGSRLLFDRAELREYVRNGGARRP